MKSRWSVWLERTYIYRWIFGITIILYYFSGDYFNHQDIFMLFNLFILCISALSFRKVWIQIFTSGVITSIGAYHAPDFSIHLSLLQWVWSFIMATFIMILIEKYIAEKRNMIDLITSLANTLDSRDNYTAFHSNNVANYSKAIAEELKLKQNVCKNIYIGGLLHDIGKIGISENVLNKSSKLTTDEFLHIKQHPSIGYELVKHIKPFEQSGVLNMILYHHERYDGKGYPKGLKGEEIPLEARIMAVADAFDAMTSHRVYREARRLEYTLNELQKERGKQFDPMVVDAFLNRIGKTNMNLYPSKESDRSAYQKVGS
ncbi:LuxR family transcriptional regulator [Mycobacteroides abscessus subsp. abscessus]|nr:LuxR family transcriptional regulator [Mycobacteroides abscessus subsp. abscessus]